MSIISPFYTKLLQSLRIEGLVQKKTIILGKEFHCEANLKTQKKKSSVFKKILFAETSIGHIHSLCFCVCC